MGDLHGISWVAQCATCTRVHGSCTCVTDHVKGADSAGKCAPFALPLPPSCFWGYRCDAWTPVAILGREGILRSDGDDGFPLTVEPVAQSWITYSKLPLADRGTNFFIVTLVLYQSSRIVKVGGKIKYIQSSLWTLSQQETLSLQKVHCCIHAPWLRHVPNE